MKRIILIILIGGFFFGCNYKKKAIINNNSNSNLADKVVYINYNISNYYPHNRSLFTEGFTFNDGQLFESTGSPDELKQTESCIGITDIPTGKFDKKITLDKSKYFGEGIVIINNKIFQLTYKSQIAFVYNKKTYKRINQFKYKNVEGWGLTTDGKHIVMSDGTNSLTYINPDNFDVIKTLKVTEDGCALNNLNELEFINGYIYANIWTTNYIVKIDTNSGKVVAKLDLSTIGEEIRNRYPDTGVMNGIAYNPLKDKIYITGKLWPFIYEIDFEH